MGKTFLGSLILITILVSCALLRSQVKVPIAAQRIAASETPLSFETLRKIIEDNNYDSVESVLAHLEKTHNSYLSYHTLVTNSYSLQSSSFQLPRAIVFGPNSDFIFTFNSQGSDKQHFTASNAIETMSFNSQTKTFELREISFKKGASDSELELFQVKPFYVSQLNPQKCLQCHGPEESDVRTLSIKSFIRPLWDPYPFWPRVYFSTADATSDYKMFPGNKEYEEFQKFNAANGNRHRGRYKYLPPPAIKNANETLTDQLYEKNYQRIARRLTMHKGQLYRYRYNFIASLVCSDLELSDLQLGVHAPFFAKVFEAIKNRAKHDQSSSLLSLYQHTGDPFFHREATEAEVPEALFLATPLAYTTYFKIYNADWSPQPYLGSVLFKDGSTSGRGFLIELVKNLFPSGEKKYLLAEIEKEPVFSSPDKLCRFIKSKFAPLK